MEPRAPSPDPTLLPPNQGELELPELPPAFGFSEEHQLLREGARRLLAERAPVSALRRTDGDVFDAQLHRELASLGWLDFRARPGDEPCLGPLHGALLLGEMGRVLLPSPYLAILLALELLESAASEEQRRRWRPSIVEGACIATVALSEPGEVRSGSLVRTHARAIESEFVLDGEKNHVLFGQHADLIFVPCREATGTLAWFAISLPAEGVTLVPEVSVDRSRPTSRLVLDGARVESNARLPGDGTEALQGIEIAGAALLAAEMVGAGNAALELTRSYAVERVQFGRAIGSFQAVKHPLVDGLIGLEMAESLALGAAALLGRGTREATVAARMAKARASDVLAFAVKKAVQLHGGFGFTWESDVHFYFKRMLWSRSTLGDSISHKRALARRLLGTTG